MSSGSAASKRKASPVLGCTKANRAACRAWRVPPGVRNRITDYTAAAPKTMRSSLLIDLSQGKKIEVEALQGSVVRRGQAAGVATPIMSALYAVLKPYAEGAVR